MREGTEYILTIGGFDPSNGAGITQDVKTLERLGRPAISALTCITVQNDAEVRSVDWLETNSVHRQVDVLLDRYAVRWVKISLVRDLASLKSILQHLKLRLPEAGVVWDPVQVSSSGYRFNSQDDAAKLDDVLRECFIVLPNVIEWNAWTNKGEEERIEQIRTLTNVCVTGGHRPDRPGTDLLFLENGGRSEIPASRVARGEKHGSGCVFASAVTAALYDDCTIEEAINRAKTYVASFIESTPGPLGNHGTVLDEKAENFHEEKIDSIAH